MKSNPIEIRVGLGSCGVASGAEPVWAALDHSARQSGVEGLIKAVGCNGMCHREPLVEVIGENGERVLYGSVSAEVAPKILRRHCKPNDWLTRTRWTAANLVDWLSPSDDRPVAEDWELDRESGPVAAYLGKQKRIVLENCGEMDPRDLRHRCERGIPLYSRRVPTGGQTCSRGDPPS